MPTSRVTPELTYLLLKNIVCFKNGRATTYDLVTRIEKALSRNFTSPQNKSWLGGIRETLIQICDEGWMMRPFGKIGSGVSAKKQWFKSEGSKQVSTQQVWQITEKGESYLKYIDTTEMQKRIAIYIQQNSIEETLTARPEQLPFPLDNEDEVSDLQRKIDDYNNRFKAVAPKKRKIISEQISRPGSITDHIKKLLDYTCQICNEQGFIQINGTRYIEAHHINELHKLIPGSYCSDNIVILCANCHRKIHFAEVVYTTPTESTVEVTINGCVYSFQRTITKR